MRIARRIKGMPHWLTGETYISQSCSDFQRGLLQIDWCISQGSLIAQVRLS